MKLVKLLVSVGLPMLVMMLSPGCVSAPKPLETAADLHCFVTEVHPSGARGTTGKTFAESHADRIVSRYIVTIDDGALVFRQHDGVLRGATFETLESKQWLRVWFAGPVEGSFPLQGTAKQIVIVE